MNEGRSRRDRVCRFGFLANQLLAALALLAVVATLALPRTAHDRADARRLGFGYPLAFVEVDLSAYTPPSYPQTYRYDPWEDPADLRTVPFVVDLALFVFALWSPLWLLRRKT